METLEISQKFNLLPETIQQQALNYIEFLYEKYVLDNIPTLTSMELTEETKKMLDDRIADAEKHPEKKMPLAEMQARMRVKYPNLPIYV